MISLRLSLIILCGIAKILIEYLLFSTQLVNAMDKNKQPIYETGDLGFTNKSFVDSLFMENLQRDSYSDMPDEDFFLPHELMQSLNFEEISEKPISQADQGSGSSQSKGKRPIVVQSTLSASAPAYEPLPFHTVVKQPSPTSSILAEKPIAIPEVPRYIRDDDFNLFRDSLLEDPLNEYTMMKHFRSKTPVLNPIQNGCLIDYLINTLTSDLSFRTNKMGILSQCAFVVPDADLFYLIKVSKIIRDASRSKCHVGTMQDIDNIMGMLPKLQIELIAIHIIKLLKMNLEEIMSVCLKEFSLIAEEDKVMKNEINRSKWLKHITKQVERCHQSEFREFFFRSSFGNKYDIRKVLTVVREQDANPDERYDEKVLIYENPCSDKNMRLGLLVDSYKNKRLRALIDWDRPLNSGTKICGKIVTDLNLRAISYEISTIFRQPYFYRVRSLDAFFDDISTPTLTLAKYYMLRSFCRSYFYWFKNTERKIDIINMPLVEEKEKMKFRKVSIDQTGREFMTYKFNSFARQNDQNACILNMIDLHTSKYLLKIRLEKECNYSVSLSDLHIFLHAKNSLTDSKKDKCTNFKFDTLAGALINSKLITDRFLESILKTMLSTSSFLKSCLASHSNYIKYNFREITRANDQVFRWQTIAHEQYKKAIEGIRDVKAYLFYSFSPLSIHAINQKEKVGRWRPLIEVLNPATNIILQEYLAEETIYSKTWSMKSQVCDKLPDNLNRVGKIIETILTYESFGEMQGMEVFIASLRDSQPSLGNFFLLFTICKSFKVDWKQV